MDISLFDVAEIVVEQRTKAAGGLGVYQQIKIDCIDDRKVHITCWSATPDGKIPITLMEAGAPPVSDVCAWCGDDLDDDHIVSSHQKFHIACYSDMKTETRRQNDEYREDIETASPPLLGDDKESEIPW